MNGSIASDILRFESDFIFFQKEIGKIRREYPNKFVAIYNSEIVASASSMREIKRELDKRGIKISKTVVEFVPEKETLTIL